VIPIVVIHNGRKSLERLDVKQSCSLMIGDPLRCLPQIAEGSLPIVGITPQGGIVKGSRSAGTGLQLIAPTGMKCESVKGRAVVDCVHGEMRIRVPLRSRSYRGEEDAEGSLAFEHKKGKKESVETLAWSLKDPPLYSYNFDSFRTSLADCDTDSLIVTVKDGKTKPVFKIEFQKISDVPLNDDIPSRFDVIARVCVGVGRNGRSYLSKKLLDRPKGNGYVINGVLFTATPKS